MRRILLIPLLAALAIPGTALAQEEEDQPPSLRLSFYMCDFNKLSEAMEEVEAQNIPVWNELIAEGMVESHGYFVHAWASEYNVGIYTIGESIESIIAAVEESPVPAFPIPPRAAGRRGLGLDRPADRPIVTQNYPARPNFGL